MKNMYEQKLKIKQKDMENMKFDEILNKLIELQKIENFCRVKENLTKFDIISRILRKENFLVGMISNDILNFHLRIKLPYFKLLNFNFFTYYIYNNLSECILNYAFMKGNVGINQNFYKLRLLQIKMFMYMLIEIVFIPSLIFFKIIFFIFRNADNIKSSRNINSQIWDSQMLICFKNYNELAHHFENRINQTYIYTEKFINCFKERLVSILSKFFVVTCGSFLFLIFIMSTIDGRLLTDLKVFGNNFVWITCFIGILLSVFSSGGKSKKHNEEDYIENVDLKESLYKSIFEKAINIPIEWRNSQNFSTIFKKISTHYTTSINNMFKEFITIILFPLIWLNIILQATKIIKFFKLYTRHVEGLGDICTYSYFNLNNFKCLKEKDLNMSICTFNDRKFVNSFLYYAEKFYSNHEPNSILDNRSEYGEFEVLGSFNDNDEEIYEQSKFLLESIVNKYEQIMNINVHINYLLF